MSRVVPGRMRAASALDVELPAVFEVEIDDVDVGTDGAWRLEVRRVVRPHDDHVIAGFEQRRRGREEGGGRAGCDEHVVDADTIAPGGHCLPQRGSPRWSP